MSLGGLGVGMVTLVGIGVVPADAGVGSRGLSGCFCGGFCWDYVSTWI